MSLMMSVESLRGAAKWIKFGLVSGRVSSQEQPLKLKDLFTIKRRLATGANNFFMLTPEQISAYQLPMEFLQPVLPSPRLLSVDEIEADSLRNPILERQLFLLSCDLQPDVVKAKYPALWEYLQIGVREGICARYLCKHRSNMLRKSVLLPRFSVLIWVVRILLEVDLSDLSSIIQEGQLEFRIS